MSLFDFFKRKNPIKEEKAKRQYPMLFAVKAPPELRPAFDKIFFETMKDVDGLSKAEKMKIHKIISGCEGGHLNQAGYYNLVYEQFFKDRQWSWGELERWQCRFDELGEYPARWLRRVPDRDIDDVGVLHRLRVSDIKGVLLSLGVELPKVKKDDLINFVMADAELKDAVLNSQNAIEIREKSKFRWNRNEEIYGFLIRTMSFRANSLCDEKRRAQLGINRTDCNLSITFEEDRKFIDIALTENPNAYPPFFPGDLSFYRWDAN
ncbi:hypothetical protein [Methylomonas rivi]|uniref:Uncharacterized protein n=1 Tax=Methylomonas rivi TaxID=2952226 RepID=A0ABT1U7G7_9GAMM|nr:hypothetical protein [Methylomonas sp. WSC-6]MCQ8129812.1 hypothetical protein [Methylomonas sp. WSC-6]